MPDDYTYTVVTADSIQLLSKRINYFKKLNTNWDYLGTMIMREKYDATYYRIDNGDGTIRVKEDKLCQVFIKKEAAAPALGGSIRQNSRKIKLQRKKRG